MAQASSPRSSRGRLDSAGAQPKLLQLTRSIDQTDYAPPDLFQETGYDIKKRRGILGRQCFNLAPSDERPRFGPTFRSLFPYFVRRQSSSGFERPERSDENQPIGNQQIALSYLLGLERSLRSASMS